MPLKDNKLPKENQEPCLAEYTVPGSKTSGNNRKNGKENETHELRKNWHDIKKDCNELTMILSP